MLQRDRRPNTQRLVVTTSEEHAWVRVAEECRTLTIAGDEWHLLEILPGPPPCEVTLVLEREIYPMEERRTLRPKPAYPPFPW